MEIIVIVIIQQTIVIIIESIPKYNIVVEKDELPKPFEIDVEDTKQLIIKHQSYRGYLGFAQLKIR